MKGVYAIFRKSDDLCLYVGQSSEIENRIKCHFYRKPRNVNDTLHNLIYKDEDNYYYKVLEECDESTRAQRERYYIEQLKPLYNKSKGGDFVRDKYPESGKDKLKQYKYNREGDNNGMYGKRWMNNGVKNKCVLPNEIDYYLNKGYTFGQIKFKQIKPHSKQSYEQSWKTRRSNGRDKMSDEQRNKLSEFRKTYYKTNVHPNVGRIRIEKDNHIKYVKKEEIDYYLDNDWKIRKKKKA